MRIGIVGSGLIGSNLARLLVGAGHEVWLSFSRSAGKLTQLARVLGAKARVSSPAEAVATSQLTVLSVHFGALDEAIGQMGDVAGKIIIDTSNPVDIDLPPGMTGAGEVLRRLPGIRLVKAFNTLRYDLLVSQSQRQPITVIPFAGDDPEANALVKGLIEEVGFQPLDVGGLPAVALLEPGGPFFNRVLTLPQAQALRLHHYL